jgi:hypothetical protein
MELGIFGFLALMYLGVAASPFTQPHIETLSENSCFSAPEISPQTHKAVMIKFQNNSDRTWKIYWIDFEGGFKK